MSRAHECKYDSDGGPCRICGKTVAEQIGSLAPVPSYAHALELLETQAAKHRENVKRLAGQLKGVERALEVEQGKLSAVEEAIASVSGHSSVLNEPGSDNS